MQDEPLVENPEIGGGGGGGGGSEPPISSRNWGGGGGSNKIAMVIGPPLVNRAMAQEHNEGMSREVGRGRGYSDITYTYITVLVFTPRDFLREYVILQK